MDRKQIILKTAAFVKSEMAGDSSGHDWFHSYRVWRNAVHIGKQEKADLFVVELAALLHDIADWKFHKGNEEIGPQRSREWMEKLSVDEEDIAHVCQIIKDVTYKGAGVKNQVKTLEGMVVQDADRLDAMGAIGIARAFAYGGSKRRALYDPDIKPENHVTFEQYKNSQSTTVNHFYEKLLLLKDRMNTATAKKMAIKRQQVMEDFLQHFFLEWEGED